MPAGHSRTSALFLSKYPRPRTEVTATGMGQGGREGAVCYLPTISQSLYTGMLGFTLLSYGPK